LRISRALNAVASKCVAAHVSPANVSPHERRAVTPRSRSNDQRSSPSRSPSRSRIAVCAPPRHTRTRVARACSAPHAVLRACSVRAVAQRVPSSCARCLCARSSTWSWATSPTWRARRRAWRARRARSTARRWKMATTRATSTRATARARTHARGGAPTPPSPPPQPSPPPWPECGFVFRIVRGPL
jgi:hypothetical protein